MLQSDPSVSFVHGSGGQRIQGQLPGEQQNVFSFQPPPSVSAAGSRKPGVTPSRPTDGILRYTKIY